MPQVFISYARPDKRKVAKIVAAMRKIGFEPWWDDDIPPGAGWEETIERALADADAVIVCWSPTSVASENVRSEARVARARGKLVQIFLEPCEPPLFFGERQGIDLTDWTGSVRDPRIKRLEDALRSAIAADTLIPTRPEKSRRLRLPRAAIAAVVGLVAVVGAAGWWLQSSPGKTASRIAVRPLETLGGTPTLASFASGLTDQIATSLNDGHIPTITRSESESLKGGNFDGRLRALEVGYLVTGTVESRGEMLHARLHLDDQLRHASLWSYETSGPANDPVALNYAIARSVGGVLSCAYRALAPGGLTDTDLLLRYLRACDLFVNHDDATDPKSTFELLNDLRLITRRAPDFAPAHSDLAKFAAFLAPLMSPADAAKTRAESALEASRALRLDSQVSDAWLARSWLVPPTDWARREALLRKAVSVNPDWPHANGFLAMFLIDTGRMRESVPYAQRAAAADLQLEWRPFSAKFTCDAGATGSTIADLRERLSNSPGDPDLQWALTWCLIDSGRLREARVVESPASSVVIGPQTFRNAVEDALISGRPSDRARAEQIGSKLEPSDRTTPFVMQWYAALGDVDAAFLLAGQFSPGYPTTGTTGFLFGPQTESMRRDPRFFGLMKRYGLAQFWQSTGRWPDICGGPRLADCKRQVAIQLAQR